ncbi:MAG: hypothetical protein ACKVQU_01280 [Burkholderiales bacterium]
MNRLASPADVGCACTSAGVLPPGGVKLGGGATPVPGAGVGLGLGVGVAAGVPGEFELAGEPVDVLDPGSLLFESRKQPVSAVLTARASVVAARRVRKPVDTRLEL